MVRLDGLIKVSEDVRLVGAQQSAGISLWRIWAASSGGDLMLLAGLTSHHFCFVC
jgi:hypothetical protein